MAMVVAQRSVLLVCGAEGQEAHAGGSGGTVHTSPGDMLHGEVTFQTLSLYPI